MLFGHRNDPKGFANCLEEFDKSLSKIKQQLSSDDLLILTADHGNDPTDSSTDHSREYVPIVLINKQLTPQNLGDNQGMTAIGASIAKWLGLNWKSEQSLI